MRKNGKNISIYVSEETGENVNKRNGFKNRSFVIERDLSRLYEAYARAIHGAQFSYEEIVTLCLYMMEKGLNKQVTPYDLRRELVYTCSREKLHERSGLASNEFVDIFCECTYLELQAFIDGAERVSILTKTMSLKEAIWEIFHTESNEDAAKRHEQYIIERMSQPEVKDDYLEKLFNIPI